MPIHGFSTFAQNHEGGAQSETIGCGRKFHVQITTSTRQEFDLVEKGEKAEEYTVGLAFISLIKSL